MLRSAGGFMSFVAVTWPGATSRGRWRGGCPGIASETRKLIREMARANFPWGAPRIHGELTLRITVSQATVPRYMPLSQKDRQSQARPAKDAHGHSPAHSRDERCQPTVGSASDSRRATQTWHRCRPDDRSKIHGKEKAAGPEDLPS